MQRLIALLALVVAMASPALADPWEGCYVGLGAGYTTHSSSVDVSNGGGTLFALDGLGNGGGEITPTIGCDFKFDRIVAGMFGDYSFNGDNSVDASLFGSSAELISIDNAWSIGGRIGYLVTDTTLIYGLVGITNADLSGFVTSIDDTLEGYTVGGGIETMLGAGFFGRLEYRHNFYDEESLPLGGGFSISEETDSDTVRASLVFKPDLFSTK